MKDLIIAFCLCAVIIISYVIGYKRIKNNRDKKLEFFLDLLLEIKDVAIIFVLAVIALIGIIVKIIV